MADTAEQQAPSKGAGPWIIITVVLAVLALGAAGAAAYFFMMQKDAPATPAAQVAEQPGPSGNPQVYLPLDPPFVVNFPAGGPVRFLQINLQVAARDEAVLDAVKEHSPAIRNDLVLLFSSQDPASLQSREGKDALRAEALKVVNDILRKQTGRGDVEAVYFTGFVMQ